MVQNVFVVMTLEKRKTCEVRRELAIEDNEEILEESSGRVPVDKPTYH